MKLNQLFKNAPEIEIEQLSTDSRLPMKNAIFFCLDGIKYDGHEFINEAINNGAKVVVYNKEIKNKNNAIYIKVKNVNETLFKIADIFYDHPNRGITKYLISGCYGRSSVSRIMSHYLNSISKCGSVGVFGINYNDRHLDITFPALTPLENLKVLNNFKESNIPNAIFETSVISLYYKKLDVIKPEVFIYTNTSKYCSDYKVCNSMYFENLRKYLYTLENNTCVLFNIDDESYNELKETVVNSKTYGQNSSADYSISDIFIGKRNTKFKIKHDNKEYDVVTKLLGLSNVYNLTCAIAALNIEGHKIDEIINKLNDIDYVDGVMESIDDKYNVIIDCGYEIDSLQNIMEYAKKTTKGKLIGIFAINFSDSDNQIKNVLQICENNLDKVILTEDESAQGEVMNILSRADKFTNSNKVLHVSYRSVAIENAISIMNSEDTLLILGKGNEKYLNMGLGKERYYGDRYYASKYINRRKEEEYETI